MKIGTYLITISALEYGAWDCRVLAILGNWRLLTIFERNDLPNEEAAKAAVMQAIRNDIAARRAKADADEAAMKEFEEKQ